MKKRYVSGLLTMICLYPIFVPYFRVIGQSHNHPSPLDLKSLWFMKSLWPVYSHLCRTALEPKMAFWQRMIERFHFSHNRCHTTLLVQDGNACFVLPARITNIFLWYVRQNLWLDPKKADYLPYRYVPWAFSKANEKISERPWWAAKLGKEIKGLENISVQYRQQKTTYLLSFWKYGDQTSLHISWTKINGYSWGGYILAFI